MATITHIRRYFQENAVEMINFLSELVLAESPTSDVGSQERPMALLTAGLEAAGLSVERVPGTTSAGCLLARGRTLDSAPNQLLLGHCDTVWPRGTLEKMPLQIDGDVMRGPGVFDMKAGLTQIVFALRAIQDLNLPVTMNPVVLINSDEEIGSLDSREFIIEQAKKVARVFVLEPPMGAEGKLKTARKGVARYKISTSGVASHSGLDPEKGQSAVVEMAHVITTLHALNDLPRGVSVNVGVIQGGSRSNVVPADCRIEVDVRALTLDEMEEVDQRIRALTAVNPAVSITITGGINRPPLEKTAGNRALWQVAEKVAADVGINLKEGTVGGGSDGNFTSPIAPTLDGLGAVGDGAHALHEHIILPTLFERALFLTKLLVS
ncbi:MAG: M20 family metallopeptidase [Ardenticatenaceae bacterium]|nr:M20 family metallopeptidase [Ardenticatenaceae bacterium]